MLRSFKLLVLAFWAGAGPVAPARASDCYSDWGMAAEIVRANKLKTVEQLSRSAEKDFHGSIVRSTLCKDGDDYIYQLVVREASGKLRAVVIDAGGEDGDPQEK